MNMTDEESLYVYVGGWVGECETNLKCDSIHLNKKSKKSSVVMVIC